MTKNTTITISELIKNLEEIKETEGDLPVVIAADEEGNGYGTLSSDFIEVCVGIDNGMLAIYPAIDHLDLDDISTDDDIDYMLTPKTKKQSYYKASEDDEEDTTDEDDDPPYGCFNNDDE